jgi:hypothetical protein
VWHFDALLAGTRRGYFSLSLRAGAPGRADEVCPLSGDVSASPPRLAALPPSGEALLLADAVGIVVSMAGAPRGNPLPFGAPPAALAHTPPYVLALTPDRRALDVWERASGARVQSLGLPPPGPNSGSGGGGGGLLGGVVNGDSGGGGAAATDDGAGRAVALARGRSLLLLLPTPLEEQARELLRGRHPDAATSLAEAAVAAATPPGGPAPPPPAWLDTLRAECVHPHSNVCSPAAHESECSPGLLSHMRTHARMCLPCARAGSASSACTRAPGPRRRRRGAAVARSSPRSCSRSFRRSRRLSAPQRP